MFHQMLNRNLAAQHELLGFYTQCERPQMLFKLTGVPSEEAFLDCFLFAL